MKLKFKIDKLFYETLMFNEPFNTGKTLSSQGHNKMLILRLGTPYSAFRYKEKDHVYIKHLYLKSSQDKCIFNWI
jgi:hypothetical protein